EPADRYQTAAALADDLRRFLDDRSIVARRARLPEQAWRWCRRNPAGAGLLAALLALLLLASGGGGGLGGARGAGGRGGGGGAAGGGAAARGGAAHGGRDGRGAGRDFPQGVPLRRVPRAVGAGPTAAGRRRTGRPARAGEEGPGRHGPGRASGRRPTAGVNRG